MTRVTLATGSNKIKLQLEYGDIVDAATLGPITPSTEQVQFNLLEAWIDSGNYGVNDASNVLTSAGGWVTDKTYTNIKIGSSSNPLKGQMLLKTLTPQVQNIRFGGTDGNLRVTLKLTGVTGSGTMEGYYTEARPVRPYNTPFNPTLSINSEDIEVSGNQSNDQEDRYWSLLWYAVEVDDILDEDAWDWRSGGFTWFGYPSAPTPNHKYRAVAQAWNASGWSGEGWSDPYYTKPPTPINVTAARRSSGNTVVDVSWSGDGIRHLDHYEVYRSLNGGLNTLIGTATSESYIDGSLPRNAVATYSVVARTPEGASTAPSTPSDVSAASNLVGNSWQPPALPATTLTRTSATTATVAIISNQTDPTLDRWQEKLDIQMSTDGGTYIDKASGISGATTSYSLTNLPANSSIKVRVRATNPSGASDYWLTSTIFTTVPAPYSLSAARQSKGSSTVDLSWSNAAQHVGTYRLESSPDGTNWSSAAVIPAAEGTSSTITQSPGVSLRYRIRTLSPDGIVISDPTNVVLVGYGYVEIKDQFLKGSSTINKMYAGTDRVRRTFLGGAVVWEDGTV